MLLGSSLPTSVQQQQHFVSMLCLRLQSSKAASCERSLASRHWFQRRLTTPQRIWRKRIKLCHHNTHRNPFLEGIYSRSVIIWCCRRILFISNSNRRDFLFADTDLCPPPKQIQRLHQLKIAPSRDFHFKIIDEGRRTDFPTLKTLERCQRSTGLLSHVTEHTAATVASQGSHTSTIRSKSTSLGNK